MANFHTNLLVVAADEQNMLKLLKLCARNLLACVEETRFSLGNIDQYESVAALYRQLHGYLDAYYWIALSGASDTTAPPGAGEVTWGVNESGREALYGGADRLGSSFGSLVGNPNIEISVSVAPTARPLSDSASVRLDEYAGTFVFSMEYSTAWEPNSGDLDAFFALLEPGNYGTAFLDADEGDSYTGVARFCGLRHGGRGIKDVDDPGADDYVDATELQKDAKKYVQIKREDIHDLAELAYAVAVCRWSEYESAQASRAFNEYYDRLEDDDEEEDFNEWYEANYPQEINYEEEYVRAHHLDPDHDGAYVRTDIGELSNSPLEAREIDWVSPKEADLSRIGGCLAEMVQRFPVHAMLDDENHEINQDAIASALAGDEVRITSTWNDSGSGPLVELSVESLDGVKMGCLGGPELWSKIKPFELVTNLFPSVACLLPHLTARVDKVMPIALRSGHARHSIFIVRIELADGAYERIEEDALALLARRCSERNSRSSVKRG